MSKKQARRVGSAGRFGARYGRVSRKRVADIERLMRQDHACPSCGEREVTRDGTGIWECNRCEYRFAGGTFLPQTPAGMEARRSVETALEETESEQ